MILTVLNNIIRTKWILKTVKLNRIVNYNKVKSIVKEENSVTVKLKKKIIVKITL